MENIPATEHKTAMATFGRVEVLQPNKVKKQMAICHNCSYVMPVLEHDMWTHWYDQISLIHPIDESRYKLFGFSSVQ